MHKLLRLTPLLIPVILFLIIAGEVSERLPLKPDIYILNWLHGRASPLLDNVFLFITTLANAAVILPVTLAIVGYLLYRRRRKDAALVTIGVGGAAAANFFLKIIFHRSRPDLWHTLITEMDYSFPSGHAMISSALAISLVAVVWHTRWRWLAVWLGSLFVVLVGLSRLYLGVHYPSDVVAGWCASLIWVSAVILVMKHRPARLHRR